MLRMGVVGLLALTVAGCASKPQQTAMQLTTSDPKFNSPECLDIRSKALTYDDKVGERFAVGLVSGLLLGPFGIPIAVAADANQNEERKAFNREIQLRCMTNPPPAEVVPVETRREGHRYDLMT